MKIARLLSGLLCLPWLAAQAQVQPIWSLPLGETVEDPRPLAIGTPVVLQDGSAYFPDANVGTRSSLKLAPDGGVVRGHGRGWSGDVVVASSPDQVLISNDDTIHLRDMQGRVAWRRFVRVSAARIMANGDVVLLSGAQLMRLRGRDGSVRWKRLLLDLHPYAEAAWFVLGDDPDSQIDLVGSLSITLPGRSWPTRHRWQAAVDPINGNVRWALRIAPGDPANSGYACAMDVEAELVAQVCGWSYPVGGIYQGATDIQMRRRGDGALLWSRRVPSAHPGNLVSIASGQLHAALWGSSELQLLGFDATLGTLRWEQLLPGAMDVRLDSTDEGDPLFSARRVDQGIDRTMIYRHRASDGELIWEFEAAQGVIAWQKQAQLLKLAHVAAYPQNRLARVETRSLATGELQRVAEDVVFGRGAIPSAVGKVGDAVCFARIPTPAAVVLKCLDGITGQPRWQRELPATMSGDDLRNAAVARLSDSRLILRTSYGRSSGSVAEVLYAATVVDIGAGDVLWRVDGLQEDPGLVSSGDGGAFMMHATCASQPACGGRQAMLDRLSGTNGARIWSRSSPGRPFAHRGDDLYVLGASVLGAPVLRLDARTGTDAWSALPLPNFTLSTGGLQTADGHLVLVHDRIMGGNRRIEVRGYDPETGVERWMLLPTVPNRVTANGGLWLLDGNLTLATGLLTHPAGSPRSPWLAVIDARDGAVQWERSPDPGRDTTRSLQVLGAAAPMQGLWVSQRRSSRDAVQRRSLSVLEPREGGLSPEHQFASSTDLAPGDPSELPVPEGLYSDGSLHARSWREVDGISLPVLQRWPAPIGPDADVVIDLETPSPALGHGPSAMVDLRIENRSAHWVTGVRPGYTASRPGQMVGMVGCGSASGEVRCIPGADDLVGPAALNLGPGAVARVRYEVSGDGYVPARSSNIGTVHFHIDMPYDVGDDLGDNTVAVEIWLGGSSNGFE